MIEFQNRQGEPKSASYNPPKNYGTIGIEPL